MKLLLPILVGMLSLLAAFAQAQDEDPAEVALGEKPDEHGLLEASVAHFKTPGLRDLGRSGPYMHDSGFDTFGEVVDLYRQTSDLQRDSAPELAGISLSPDDAASLVAFVHALNEDYD